MQTTTTLFFYFTCSLITGSYQPLICVFFVKGGVFTAVGEGNFKGDNVEHQSVKKYFDVTKTGGSTAQTIDE